MLSAADLTPTVAAIAALGDRPARDTAIVRVQAP